MVQTYIVQASVSHIRAGWRYDGQLPTFFLRSDVQSITDLEHAKTIAEGLLRRCSGPDAELHVHVMPFVSLTEE